MIRSAVIALGSNLGDRRVNLRRAVAAIGGFVRVVRLSRVWETEPVDAPPGSGPFLNMVVAGWTTLRAAELLAAMHGVEATMGRVRRRRNEPRAIDLDLIFCGGELADGGVLVPHPRYRERDFVVGPLGELALPWVDPATSIPLSRLRAGSGESRAFPLY
jgi:2-amino-4-hydroxy-6-hydroxymethyldihydropteridine diphosphokinase